MAPEFYSSHYHHKSRAMGLLKFIFDRRIGLDSRPIRELRSFRLTAKSAA
jgi:hypothetical protein